MTGILGRKLLLLLGTTLLLVLYLWGHNSLAQARLLAHGLSIVAGALADGLVVIALVTIGGGLGRRLVRTLPLSDLSRGERTALEAVLGLGLISAALVLVGMAGFYQPGLWIGLGLVALVTGRLALGWLADARQVVALALRPATGFERFITLAGSIALGLALLGALAPPHKWDAMTYHLEGPRRYLEVGAIRVQDDNHYLGFPQTVELLYGLTMATGRDTSPALLHFAFGWLALTAIAGFVRRHADPTSGRVAVAIALTSLSLAGLFAIPYVDLALLAYGMATLIAYDAWRTTDDRRLLVLAGALAGLCVAVKYTGGGLAIALGLAVLIANPRAVVRNGPWVALGGLALTMPWLAKGLLLYENPIYPYVFGGVNWDSWRTLNFNVSAGGLLNTDLAWHWPILPISATIFATEDISPYNFTLGPWWLTLPFALLIVWGALSTPARRAGRHTLALAIPLLLFWMGVAALSGLGPQPRLMLMGGGPAAVLAGLAWHGLQRWPRRPLDAAFLMRIIIGLTFILNGFNLLSDLARSGLVPYYAGELSRDAYLTRNLGILYPALRQLDDLPSGSRVLFLYEPKTYYCPAHVTCIPDQLFDNWARPLLNGMTPHALMRQWRMHDGIDYLLVYGLESDEVNIGYRLWLEAHTFAREANARFPVTLADYTTRIWTDGVGYGLYTWPESEADPDTDQDAG